MSKKKEEKKSPKVTYELTPVVCVRVQGQEDRSHRELPAVRDDGGLVGRLHEFLNQNGTNYPAVRGGCVGCGSFFMFLTAEDAERAETWLREQGAEADEFGY